MAAGCCHVVTHIHYVLVRFVSFCWSTSSKECIASFLVRIVPQGLQVPREELHRDNRWT